MRTKRLPWIISGAALLGSSCTEDIPDVTPFGNDTGMMTSTAGDDGVDANDDDGTTTGGVTSTSGATANDSTGLAGSSSDDDDDDHGGAICGDGIISGNEECDCSGGPCTVKGLDGNTCADVIDPLNPNTLTGGTLGCKMASCKYDYTMCTSCGDGKINGNEGCEPGMAIGETCLSLGAGGVGDLSCDAACQIDTAGCTECGGEFNFDAKNCPGGWEVGNVAAGSNNVSWACGVATSGPAGKEGVWATNIDGDYNANESSYLRSPTIDLGACGAGESVEMRVYHWFEFEGGPSNRDGGIVQVSSNGTNWTTIQPTSGTLYIPAPLNTSFFPDGQHGFSGNDPDEGTWVQSNFDVSAYAGGADLRVRFVFGSDGSSENPGWYIDRVAFVGSGV